MVVRERCGSGLGHSMWWLEAGRVRTQRQTGGHCVMGCMYVWKGRWHEVVKCGDVAVKACKGI